MSNLAAETIRAIPVKRPSARELSATDVDDIAWATRALSDQNDRLSRELQENAGRPLSSADTRALEESVDAIRRLYNWVAQTRIADALTSRGSPKRSGDTPNSPASPAPAPESLEGIADKTGVTLAELRDMNPHASAYRASEPLPQGLRLRVPKARVTEGQQLSAIQTPQQTPISRMNATNDRTPRGGDGYTDVSPRRSLEPELQQSASHDTPRPRAENVQHDSRHTSQASGRRDWGPQQRPVSTERPQRPPTDAPKRQPLPRPSENGNPSEYVSDGHTTLADVSRRVPNCPIRQLLDANPDLADAYGVDRLLPPRTTVVLPKPGASGPAKPSRRRPDPGSYSHPSDSSDVEVRSGRRTTPSRRQAESDRDSSRGRRPSPGSRRVEPKEPNQLSNSESSSNDPMPRSRHYNDRDKTISPRRRGDARSDREDVRSRSPTRRGDPNAIGALVKPSSDAGSTLSEIAFRSGINVSDLRELNRDTDRFSSHDRLPSRMALRLPPGVKPPRSRSQSPTYLPGHASSTADEGTAASPRAADLPPRGRPQVISGHTAWVTMRTSGSDTPTSIAEKYRIAVDLLYDANVVELVECEGGAYEPWERIARGVELFVPTFALPQDRNESPTRRRSPGRSRGDSPPHARHTRSIEW